ncbi:Uncharacterised protein at_DN0191, partial [Pycnogonum litorale]
MLVDAVTLMFASLQLNFLINPSNFIDVFNNIFMILIFCKRTLPIFLFKILNIKKVPITSFVLKLQPNMNPLHYTCKTTYCDLCNFKFNKL